MGPCSWRGTAMVKGTLTVEAAPARFRGSECHNVAASATGLIAMPIVSSVFLNAVVARITTLHPATQLDGYLRAMTY